MAPGRRHGRGRRCVPCCALPGMSSFRRPIPASAPAPTSRRRLIDLSTHIQDVVGVLEFEDLKDVVLLGHSYGGMVRDGRRRQGTQPYCTRRVSGCVRAEGRPEPVRPRRPEGRGQHARKVPRKMATAGSSPSNPMPPDTAPEDVAWASPRRRPQPIKTFEQKIKLESTESAAAAPLHLCQAQHAGRCVPPVRRSRQQRGRLDL